MKIIDSIRAKKESRADARIAAKMKSWNADQWASYHAEHHHPNCDAPYGVCRGKHSRHYRCYACGSLTCLRSAVIEKGTLQRRIRPVCAYHDWRHPNNLEQEKLRLERTRQDWLEVTDRLRHEVIVMGVMPEQYSGTTRMVLRVFADSEQIKAVVPGVSPTSLNQSIIALGLGDTMYAEQRNEQTVLRKIEKP